MPHRCSFAAMISAYNFLGSWQVFPEKGTYEQGQRPLHALYKIETGADKNSLRFTLNWTALEGSGFETDYTLLADGNQHHFKGPHGSTAAQVRFFSGVDFTIDFIQSGLSVQKLEHQILPNGWLQLKRQGFVNGQQYTNTEFYHKQQMVMPYAASVAGAVIKPTEEGVIRHKALTAMEEQTNTQLEQIRKQVELLALQAQEIFRRKELSQQIYESKLAFKPEIGQVYYLYQKKDDSRLLSLISPQEWGSGMPYKKFVAAVQLLSDHTWKEVNP